MINLIIPTCNPPESFTETLDKIYSQTIKDITITIIDSDSQNLDISAIKKYKGLKFISIKKSRFNHGGTRNLGACTARYADFFVFMTQDAVPKNSTFINELIAPFSDPYVAAVYGKQTANENAKDLERFARLFNYPEESFTKTKSDIEILGIKAFFLTNVCSAYRSTDFFEFGGFPEKTICNEDMILASRFILGNRKIVYNPKAEVYHSHNYSYNEQFRRNFDIGVSLRENDEILRYARSEKEGVKYVKNAIKYCFYINKPYLIISLFFESVLKLFGYNLGINHKKLPKTLCKYLSLNRGYWK